MGQSRRIFSMDLENLELRRLLSAALRSYDGTGNNLSHPTWGSAGSDLLRESPVAYADGIAAPSGANRPSARVISNAVSDAGEDPILNSRAMSAWVYVWGQFIDHDLDLTGSATPAQPFNVDVPSGDPQFDPARTGTQQIFLNRSIYDPATGLTNARQQTTAITAWLDGSVVYGSDATRAAALRSFVGGKLKTSAGGLMPFNTAGLANANDAHLLPDSQLFLAGDVRANENIDLISLQTLFVREHNRWADQIAKAHPHFTDEQIYQQARQIVGAEIAAITYNEFLPALLGQGAIPRYRGYNSSVNPGISTEFSTAAFRLGHSLLGDDIEFMDNNGEEVHDAVELKDAFFNPTAVEQMGIDPIMKYLASDDAQEIDTKIVDSVRNFLFGPPGAGGFDLASLNIQRGRDHGLADYNTIRAAYGLQKARSFSDITSDTAMQSKLKQLYGSVNNIDVWVGGLAEDHVAGSSLGSLFRTIVADQFSRIRDGDRFWYQRQLAGTSMLNTIQSTTLADIISRNSGTHNLQDNVFFFNASISGKIFNDSNGNGRLDRRESGMVGWTANLLDENGAIVDTTKTSSRGAYSFSQLDLGTYDVSVTPPNGWHSTNKPGETQLTRGITISNVNYGYAGNTQGTVATRSSSGRAQNNPFSGDGRMQDGRSQDQTSINDDVLDRLSGRA